MPFLGHLFGGQSLTLNSVPPTGCYFEVSIYPFYLNAIKVRKIANILQRDEIHWTVASAVVSIVVASAVVGVGVGVGGAGVVGAGVGGVGAGVGLNPLDFRFNKVSGLSTEIETEEIRVGGLNTEMLQLPNRVKHGNLVLERGLFVGSPLTVEFNAAMTLFQMIPCEILVTLQKPNKLPLAAWLFRNAYPVSWSNSDLCSDDNGIFMEKMEFAYSHFYPIRV